jgi:hypothetical protein
MAMFSFPSADFDVDYRDAEAQKCLLRERMAGLGWLTPRILAHLDDTPDFYLDQVAQVVMDWSSAGRRRRVRRRWASRIDLGRPPRQALSLFSEFRPRARGRGSGRRAG